MISSKRWVFKMFSDDLLESMFGELIVYVWGNNPDDECWGAVLIKIRDLDKVQNFGENISSDESAQSFSQFVSLLKSEQIPYYDISNSMYYYTWSE